MNILIIGIDGGQSSIIELFDMPFLQGLLESAQHFCAQEDLHGRGWAKILSGLPGAQTGAFYSKPVLGEKGCESTQRFRVSEYDGQSQPPLWEMLNRKGLSVGFMNVPTTFPAPAVDGFFVSGAGAGLGSLEMPPEGVFPSSVGAVLRRQGYIADTRYVASGIRQPDEYISRLERMTERRVGSYVELNQEHRPDVGMVAFMGPKSIQYLAYQELEAIEAAKGSGADLTPTQKRICRLYQHFDEQMRLLVEAVQPERVLLVSDHGQAPYRYQLDLGHLLRQQGIMVLRRERQGATLKAALRAAGKRMLPENLYRKAASSTAARKAVGRSSAIDFERSRAFTLRYVPGVYVNDERFQGPVQTADERHHLVDSIVEEINRHAVEQSYGLSAKAYRQVAEASDHARDLLPDVWLSLPEDMFCEFGIGGSEVGPGGLVIPNPNYGKPLEWENITRDQWTGIKGRSALLALNGHDGNLDLGEVRGDLTDAYKIIERAAQ